MMLTSLLATLLVVTCHAEYYHIVGTDFNDYLGNSYFHVESYYEVSQYGLPPPPGGEQSYALYLTDLTNYSQTSVISVPSTGLVTFEFVFFCDGSGSELEMRISYPWQGDAIHLCGPKNTNEQPGQWVTETFTKECLGTTCTNLQLWLAGETNAYDKITGLYSLSVITDGATFPPTAGPTVTTDPTTEQTTTTTTMPTTTTTTPATTTTTIPTTTTTPTTPMPSTTTPTTTTPVTTYTTTPTTTMPTTTSSTNAPTTTTTMPTTTLAPTTSTTTTPTTSTIATTEDATTPEPVGYEGPFDNIWGNSQCATPGFGEDKSVSECMTLCDETPGCTAFNYREAFSDCFLRSCPLPVPPPEMYNTAYQGYAKA